MPKILVGTEEVYYQHHRGPADRARLLLVHGAGGNHMHWPGSLRRLTGRDVYSVDLPGHGKSGGGSCDSVTAYAEFLRDFVLAAGLTRVVLAGHSMGGAISQEFALRYPGSLAGIVLIGTGAKLRVAPHILDGIMSDYESTTALVTDWSWAADAPVTLRREALRSLRQVSAAIIHDDYQACDRFDRRDRIREIGLPVLLICGTEDRMTPPKFSEWLQRQLSDARLALVPGGGHMVMLEQPDAVTASVAGFLDDVDRRSAEGPTIR